MGPSSLVWDLLGSLPPPLSPGSFEAQDLGHTVCKVSVSLIEPEKNVEVSQGVCLKRLLRCTSCSYTRSTYGVCCRYRVYGDTSSFTHLLSTSSDKPVISVGSFHTPFLGTHRIRTLRKGTPNTGGWYEPIELLHPSVQVLPIAWLQKRVIPGSKTELMPRSKTAILVIMDSSTTPLYASAPPEVLPQLAPKGG